MLLGKSRNSLKQYSIVDEEGNVIIYFRVKRSATDWLREHESDYPGMKLKLVRNK